jgi:hypothetical protein
LFQEPEMLIVAYDHVSARADRKWKNRIGRVAATFTPFSLTGLMLDRRGVVHP